MIKLKTIKNLTKRQRKQIKNQKKNDQTEINIIIIEKNYKFDLKDKIKTINIIIIKITKIINLLRLKTIKNHKL